MKCYKWIARDCENWNDHSSEFCELEHRPEDSGPINGTHLVSPQFDRLVAKKRMQRFGKAYFCVYNVSMSCPSNAVTIATSNRTTWPAKSDTAACENYVAFYSNSSRTYYDQGNRYCGQPGYNTTLYNDSFIAVMWTNHRNNFGVFEFTARCSDHQAPSAPTTSTPPASEITGSGLGLGGEEVTVVPNTVENN